MSQNFPLKENRRDIPQ